MNRKIQNWFLFSTAVILFVTAAFILLSATSKVPILNAPDPILTLSNRRVFFLVSGLELAVSAFLLLVRNSQIRLLLTAGLAVSLLAYHVGLAHYREPNLFVCLGNFTDWVTLPPRILNGVTLTVLGWMLLGSIGLLAWGWVSRRKGTPAASTDEVTSPQTG
jgi:hypothetical protein